MSTYVLIHGAWQGSWCWDKVVPLLKQAGHSVEAPDLPRHGQDKTPLPEVILQAYTTRVCETLDAQSAHLCRKRVAISLSPCESLLIPLRCARRILHRYVRRSISNVPLIELNEQGRHAGSTA